jgi:hypothetical protein
MAMIAAVMCLLVVITLTTVGMRESLGSLSSGTQSRKLQQNLDAAEAGLQAELNAIGNVAGGTNTVPLACSSGKTAILPSGINGITTYYNVTLTPEAALPASLTPAPCSGNYTQTSITSNPYVLVTSTGTTSDPLAGGTNFGRVLKAVVSVTNISTSTSYQPHASAYGGNISVLGLNFPMAKVVADPTTEGTAQTPTSTQILTGQSILTVGALGSYAETQSNGTSFACAGVLTSPGVVQVGTSSSPCANVNGTGSGNGVTVNLLPLLGSLSSVAGIFLTANAITSWATEAGAGSPSGSANVLSLKVYVTLVGGLVTVGPVSITVPANLPNWDLVNGTPGYPGLLSALNSLVPGLGTTVKPLLSAETDYQVQTPTSPSTGAELEVSALHLSAIGSAVSADLAEVTVGPDNPATITTPANVQVQKIVQSS